MKASLVKWPLAVLLPATPLLVAAMLLSWLGSSEGVDWAHSLWTKDHPLNFGGNPAEVLSHLLNWIVMTSSTAGLCLASITIVILKAGSSFERKLDDLPVIVSCLVIFIVLAWAVHLDSKYGEGAVGMSFVLFFGPCTLVSAIASRRLLTGGTKVALRILFIVAMFPLSLALQWFYEPSGSGGPNLLVFPLLCGQAAVWWCIGRALRRDQPVGIEAP